MTGRRVGALLLLLATVAPTSAPADAASEQASGARITLGALLEVARAESPEIHAAEARYREMAQRPIQERTLPDPSLGVAWHNERFDRITFGESEFSFVEFSAEQEVPFPGKLGLRGRIAERRAEREGAMRDAVALMVLARVATRYFDLAVVERSADILRDGQEALDLMVEQSDTSYRVGSAAQQDVLRARLERGALEERLTMLEQRREAAVAAINALLARPPTQALPPTAGMDDPPPLEPFDELVSRVTAEAPELRAAREEVLRSDDALALARREYLPDFALMGSYMNKNPLFPEWELGVRVKVPLYFWRRQGPAVAEAAYARSAAEQTRRNAQVTLEGRLRELHAMGSAATRLVRLYAERLLPEASLTLESARASYAVGKVDFLTTVTAFTALLEYRLRYVEEIGNLHRSRAEIGPLIGEAPAARRRQSR